MTWMSATTAARVRLGEVVYAALHEAEEYMREAEAQHAVVKTDAFFTDADRRASLTEVTLAHRAVSMLKPLAGMIPMVPDETPTEVATAHHVVHPPTTPGWSRVADDEVGGLARGLWLVAHVRHFDLHASDDGTRRHLFVDPEASAKHVFVAASWALDEWTLEGTEAREMPRYDDRGNPALGETMVARFSRLPVPP